MGKIFAYVLLWEKGQVAAPIYRNSRAKFSVHGPSVNMILGHIPLIENFSMKSNFLLLGYSLELE